MAYKMAIIGYGGMGNWHRKNIAEKVSEFQVVAAYDVRDEIKEKIKADGLKLYSSPAELYADDSIDLVLVATPNDVHKNYSIECMRSGKNVICEKPVTLNAAELEEVIAVSKETGKLFTIHHNRRWDSDFLTIKRILDKKILTKPYIVESRVQGARKALHGWRAFKVNGGGMVLDWGIHLIDQLMFLFPQKVVSVSAHLHSMFTPEVDDHFDALLRFEDGMTALVNVSVNSLIKQPRWHMTCEDGTAMIENWEMDGKIVKLAPDSIEQEWAETIVYTAAGPTRTMAPLPKNTTVDIELPKVKGDWSQLYKNVAAAIDKKEELIVKPEQALRVMKVVDKIFEASKNNAQISCNI